MANKFIADPAVLNTQGNKVLSQAEQFTANTKKIYEIVNEMISSSYMSPEAIEIAKKIQSYKESLDRMNRTMGDYGNYLINAANKVVRNQQDIIDSVRSGRFE